MSELAFLDSGAIYALTDAADLDHRAVQKIYTDDRRRFVTCELILVEAFSLLTKRLHKRAALHMIGALRHSPRIEIVPVGTRFLDAAWARCELYSDKEWDWIDCVSFELMQQRRLRDALTLDHHFTQAGFVRLVQ